MHNWQEDYLNDAEKVWLPRIVLQGRELSVVCSKLRESGLPGGEPLCMTIYSRRRRCIQRIDQFQISVPLYASADCRR